MKSNECPKCRTTLAEEFSDGLCPQCLLETGMERHDEATNLQPGEAETIDSGAGNSGRPTTVTKSGVLEPETFSDYELIEEIARGGMGVVYRARHRKLGREVAMKVILSGKFASANDVRRFHMEAESAASLDHPGIVPIYEIGEAEGHHFYTMKLVTGGSFAERMPELRGDVRQFVRKLSGIADAIDFAHRRGILHRDIKPANLLFDADDQPLVTDLGLAKQIESDSDLTGTGAIVGTPAYMPPEQASGSKEVTTAADVYSIGAILYEGLVGRPPHQAESAVKTLLLSAQGEIQPPSEIDRKVDRTLERICMKCLERNPVDRYASAGLLANDLQAWLNGESVSVRPKSFASTFSDVLASQFRSVLGALLLGLLGGLALGIPSYSGLAADCIDSELHDVWISGMGKLLPRMKLGDAWWLQPPGWVYSFPTFLAAILFALSIGFLMEKIVRPKDLRQAIAFGLVAALLMTIVQFSFYGIGAGFKSLQNQNLDEIQHLGMASLGTDAQQKTAADKLLEQYSEVREFPAEERGEMLGRCVALKLMLSMPVVFVGCLAICLIIATFSCVGGAVHAHRVKQLGVGLINQMVRYGEVMFLLFIIAGILGAYTFYVLGMSQINTNSISPTSFFFIAIGVLILTAVPGIMLARWYIRWGAYLLLFGFIVMAS